MKKIVVGVALVMVVALAARRKGWRCREMCAACGCKAGCRRCGRDVAAVDGPAL